MVTEGVVTAVYNEGGKNGFYLQTAASGTEEKKPGDASDGIFVYSPWRADEVEIAKVYYALSEHLGIGHDETTEDGTITLERIECNAACDYAPVVMVNWDFFDNQTPSSVRDLVDALRAGERPVPSLRAAEGGRRCRRPAAGTGAQAGRRRHGPRSSARSRPPWEDDTIPSM